MLPGRWSIIRSGYLDLYIGNVDVHYNNDILYIAIPMIWTSIASLDSNYPVINGTRALSIFKPIRYTTAHHGSLSFRIKMISFSLRFVFPVESDG